jgi:hypothetical protein
MDPVPIEEPVSLDDAPVIKDNIDMSNIKNIILIDKNIESSDLFFSSGNDETLAVSYNYYTDREKLLDSLKNLFSNIERVALIFDNSMMNNKYFLNAEPLFTENDISQFETNAESTENYSNNVEFLIKFIKHFDIKRVDFLVCNSLQYSNWTTYYELLQHNSNAIIGASKDLTGNLSLGANWVMENTSEDIKNVYFNENINNYNSTLLSSSISYSSFNIFNFASGKNTLLFELQVTNSPSSVTLTNFSGLLFSLLASSSQKTLSKVYWREKNIGQFSQAGSLVNLNISLEPSKTYEMILQFPTNIFGNAAYTYEKTSNTAPTLLNTTVELKMFSSYAGSFSTGSFNPNNSTMYNSLKTGSIVNQLLTLNYDFTQIQKIPTITGFTIPTKTYGDSPFTITQPSSDSTGSFIYSSNNADVATISGNRITITGAGTAIITATQAATPYYTSGTAMTTFNVNKKQPTILFLGILPKTYGDSSFTISNPISNSPGSFTYTSLNTGVATISGNRITITGAGSATIVATQLETKDYTSGTATTNFTVYKAIPSLSNFEIPQAKYGDGPVSITPPTSNSPGLFSYKSLNTFVATISGSTITIESIGYAFITATQAETPNYTSAITITTFQVIKGDPIITGFNIPSAVYGAPSFRITAPNSTSTGTFTYTSLNTDVATISGNTITIVDTGSSTIIATQAATYYYNSGTATTTFTVNSATPTLSDFYIPSATFGDSPVSITPPTSTSNGAFTYISETPSVATVENGNKLRIVGAGIAIIKATQAATDDYLEATITTEFIVKKADPQIGNFSIPQATNGNPPFQISPPTSTSTGPFTCMSSNPLVATVENGNKLRIVGTGTTIIILMQEETDNYNPGTASTEFEVLESTPANPTVIDNGAEFSYFMESTSTYGAVNGIVIVNNNVNAFETKIVGLNGIFTIL